MRMRVVIPLASSSRELSGVQRHAVNVARCLLTRDEISAVHLVASPWQQEFVRNSSRGDDPRLHLHSAPISSNATSRNLWYYYQLPGLAVNLRADIVHLAYPAPLRGNALRVPSVVTLHDLYPFDIPDNFGFPKVLINQMVLRQCLAAASAIACVSESTLSRLDQLEPAFVRRKAKVIGNSVEAQPQVSASSPVPGWRGQSFLLCVAQHRRNKNILFLLEVFKSLLRKSQIPSETQLVIVGTEGPETKAIHRFLKTADIAGRVALLKGLGEAELQWCYRNCALLLAPSTVEGFGLPVAEALLAGCRVICSDIPPFREVGGEHCLYISLNSRAEEAFAGAVSAVFNEPHPAPVALPQLSPSVIAEKYLQLYRSLLCRTDSSGEERLDGSMKHSEEELTV
jgi:glycosyltransferase involved in cell wall biosynthesis